MAGISAWTGLLVLLAIATPAVLALRWREISRLRRVGFTLAAVALVCVVGRIASRFAPVLRYRVEIGRDPAQQARAAVAAGDRSFAGYNGVGTYVPGIDNVCLQIRNGVRTAPGLTDVVYFPGDEAYRRGAHDYALAYNAALAGLLEIPSAERVRRTSGRACPPE